MLKQALRKIIKGQKGQVLPIVLILLVLGGLLIVPTLNYASTSLKGHQVVESKTLEFYAADSGIEDALHWLINGKQAGAWTWDEVEGSGARITYSINGRDVDVDVELLEEEGSNIYKITSVATSPDGSTTVLSTIWAVQVHEGDITIDGEPYEGNLYVDGNITLEDGATHEEGDVCASGDITLGEGAKIETGSVFAGGNVTLADGAKIETGNLCTTGEMLLVEGEARIEDNIKIMADNTEIRLVAGAKIECKNIYVIGNVTISLGNGAKIEKIEDEGAIWVIGNVTISLADGAEMQHDVHATGDIYIEGDFPEEKQHPGSDESSYPPPPECPEWSGGSSAQIFTYEIT